MAANNFTEATSKTLNAAVELATSKGHALVEPAHVAAKLFASGELGDRVAKKAGADAAALRDRLAAAVDARPAQSPRPPSASPSTDLRKALESDEFDAMLRASYAPLLRTAGYRFVGDASAWQIKKGMERPEAVKEYTVELKMSGGGHMLARFKLVYDWLLYCHLIATCELFDMSSKAFPGTEDISLDI